MDPFRGTIIVSRHADDYLDAHFIAQSMEDVSIDTFDVTRTESGFIVWGKATSPNQIKQLDDELKKIRGDKAYDERHGRSDQLLRSINEEEA